MRRVSVLIFLTALLCTILAVPETDEDDKGVDGRRRYPGSGNPGGRYPGQVGQPNRDRYPGQGGYPDRDRYPGQGGYPDRDRYPGQGGHHDRDRYPGQGGYPDRDRYPGQGGYPGGHRPVTHGPCRYRCSLKNCDRYQCHYRCIRRSDCPGALGELDGRKGAPKKEINVSKPLKDKVDSFEYVPPS
ncbi:annexin A7-like [Ornithodoros turicata]|uniref:annexin A7-like n=1 Tax=Ornithodoros turicata TaxID=34597 RepID=UPI0031387919